MNDGNKMKLLLTVCVAVVALVLASSVFQDSLLEDLGGYVKRRYYYERVISKKNLSQQKGLYWKEKP